MITTSESGDITLITIADGTGCSVTLSSLGAGITSLCVPDRNGQVDDVVLGYADINDYRGDGPCAGKIPGRYANRIAAGHFTLDGEEYTLAVNCGPNALHGGPTGFHNRNWRVEEAAGDSVLFAYRSADGEEGYPGTLDVTARYTLLAGGELRLELRAVTDRKTVVNLTNHTYFNLDGHDAGLVFDHILRLNAMRYLPTDPSLVPTGALDPVMDTPMDFFSVPKPLGRDISADFPALRYAKGYDCCYAVEGYVPGLIREAAVLESRNSGRRLTVMSDFPGVQLYTGNWLTGSPLGKGGAVYEDYSGVAIECQGFPDAPNKPDFPSAVLSPGEEYHRTIIFKFSTI